MFINCHVFQKDSDQDSWDFLRRRGWFIDVGHWEHLPIIAYPILWQLRSYPNFHENTSPVSQVFPFAETEATNFECRQHPTAQLDQLLKTRRQLWIFSEPPCLSCFVNFALFILFGSCFGLRLTRGKVSGCRWLPVHKTELRRTSSRDSTRHRKSKAAKCSKVSNNIKNIQEPAKVSTERHNWRAADGLATHSSYRWREFNGRSRIYETLWNHMTPKRAGMEKQPKRTLALLRHRKIKSEKKKKNISSISIEGFRCWCPIIHDRSWSKAVSTWLTLAFQMGKGMKSIEEPRQVQGQKGCSTWLNYCKQWPTGFLTLFRFSTEQQVFFPRLELPHSSPNGKWLKDVPLFNWSTVQPILKL